MRGTPHMHCLISVRIDGITEKDIESLDLDVQKKVKDLVMQTVQAILVADQVMRFTININLKISIVCIF